MLFRSFALFLTFVAFLPAMSLADDKAASNTIVLDPFSQKSTATDLLVGIWNYTANHTINVAPAANGPPVYQSKDGVNGFLDPAAEKDPVEKPVLHEKEMTIQLRLDIRASNTFRFEMARTDHAEKVFEYMFVEGAWSLRGRLLVLTVVMDGDAEPIAIFIDQLEKDRIEARGTISSDELFANGRGSLVREAKPHPIRVPTGYSLEVDEVSFGPTITDVATHLKNSLNPSVEVEYTDEK